MYNKISSQGVTTLFDMLRSKNSSIKTIHLMGNKDINDECIKALGEYLKCNKNITSIDMGATQISDAGIATLMSYLDGNMTFRHFRLAGNKAITNESIPSLIKMIESSHLENLDISCTSITQKNALGISISLRVLKLESSKLYLSGK